MAIFIWPWIPLFPWPDESRSLREELEFAEFDEADACDGFDLAEGFDGGAGGGGVGDVDLDDGEGLSLWDALGAGGAGWIYSAAQGEVGDVDGVLSEDGADAADDAGDVVVADGDQGAGERGFDV